METNLYFSKICYWEKDKEFKPHEAIRHNFPIISTSDKTQILRIIAG